jgi:hypothetical protein
MLSTNRRKKQFYLIARIFLSQQRGLIGSIHEIVTLSQRQRIDLSQSRPNSRETPR